MLIIGLSIFFQVIIIFKVRHLNSGNCLIVLINRTVIGDLGIQQCVQADPPVLGIQNIVTLFRYQISILIQCKLSCTGVFGVGLSCLIGKFNGKKPSPANARS